MGYNGMGYQRWIANLKPRKFLAGRSKPDVGGAEARLGYFNQGGAEKNYNFKHATFKNPGKKKFSADYRQQLEHEFQKEKRKKKYINILSWVISVIALLLLLAFLTKKFYLI
ncbi:MAG: hypothetical protein CSA36_00100 [Draconibacterium sp.]|nr:MAG: hypothetical protein CSA36_00100 [Draconibacterium sp.]